MDAGLGRSAAVDRTLSALVRERGAAAWTDPKASSKYLRDGIPNESGRIDTLIAAAEIGLVAEMVALPGRDNIREAQFAQRLVFERYYSDSDARFAVEAWARALWEPTAPAPAHSAPEAAPVAPSAPTAAVTPPPPPPATLPPTPTLAARPAPSYAPTAPAIPPSPAAPVRDWRTPVPPTPTPPTPPAPPATRRHASMPAPVEPPIDFGPVTPPTKRTARSRQRTGGKGLFAVLRPIVFLLFAVWIMSSMVSQCNNSDSSNLNDSSTSSESTQPANDAETYALDTLGYVDATSVTASEVVSGLGEAPAPIRNFVASYTSQSANSEVNWLAVTDENGGTGYVALKPTDTDFAKQLAVIHTSDGKYTLSGPLAAGIPSQ